MKTTASNPRMARGYATAGADQPLRPFTFERRSPNDEDVVIDIAYCGVCHSDVHAAHNAWGMSHYPMVPGHEITGVVREVGKAVARFKKGDRVGIGCFIDSCTTQGHRDRDHEHYLPGLVLTYNGFEPGSKAPTLGGYSDSIVVKEGYVLSVPEALPLDAAAPLLCAGVTVYSPLRKWQVGPGAKVAIVGLGGLGHVAVKMARAMGAEVTVLSRTLKKRDDALKLGAKAVFATESPATFADLASAFDLVLSTVSGDVDWNAYLGLIRLDGTFITVGVPDGPVPVSAFPLIVGRRRLAGSYMGSIKETQEMLDFCARHGVTADIEIIAIQDINTAFARVAKSDVRYRFVIDLASLDKEGRAS
ncbi:NAD(P)-dependent alcohol dehydrogenase [Sorangium sp. So ce295]|uniref:NAD(P)-dependent alcohol dehydrogenase n=1 Tax=Sorangium sp. So ce295 TaxID=3133295 RepID=UPI003F610C55